jgi:hypothetical protein
MRRLATIAPLGLSALGFAMLLSVRTATSSITVAAEGDLQQALNAARPGDTILLPPGATYVGHFVLPARTGSDTRVIVLRTAGPDVVASGVRLAPGAASSLARLRSPDGSPTLSTAPGARFWRVELLEFMANRDGQGDIIALGDGSSAQNSTRDLPSDLVFDRVYIHGDPRLGQKRGIALNSGRAVISNSYIADIKAKGQDSQAIGGWNGTGDYLIENNYLEAAGENVMFGGADPSIRDLVPSRIVIRGNTLTKPLAWRDAGSGDGGWQVKNLFELKNARDVTLERNRFERNWSAAQSGYALLFTVRNQDGGCPWCVVENVQFRQNIIRDVAAGIQILGSDTPYPSRQANAITIRDNLFDGIDRKAWGGDGYFLQITSKPRNLIIDHNTVIQGESSGVAKIEDLVYEFVFTNNIASHGSYGFIATNQGVGNDTIRKSLPGSIITANVLEGGDRRLYPPGNLFPTQEEFKRQFVDFSGHDFRLKPDSAWVKAGIDGRGLGALLETPRLAVPR